MRGGRSEVRRGMKIPLFVRSAERKGRSKRQREVPKTPREKGGNQKKKPKKPRKILAGNQVLALNLDCKKKTVCNLERSVRGKQKIGKGRESGWRKERGGQ